MNFSKYCILLFVCLTMHGMEDLKNIVISYNNELYEVPRFKEIHYCEVQRSISLLSALKLSPVLKNQCEDNNNGQKTNYFVILTPDNVSNYISFDTFMHYVLINALLVDESEQELSQYTAITGNHLQSDFHQFSIRYLLSLVHVYHYLDFTKIQDELIENLKTRLTEFSHEFAQNPYLFFNFNPDLKNNIARKVQGETCMQFFKELKPKKLGQKPDNFEVLWTDRHDASLLAWDPLLKRFYGETFCIAIEEENSQEFVENIDLNVSSTHNLPKLVTISALAHYATDDEFDEVLANPLVWGNPTNHYYTDQKGEYMLEMQKDVAYVYSLKLIKQYDAYFKQKATIEQVLTLSFLREKVALDTIYKESDNCIRSDRCGGYWYERKHYTDIGSIKVKKSSPAHYINWAVFPHLKEAYDSLASSESLFQKCLDQCENKLPVKQDEARSCTIM